MPITTVVREFRRLNPHFHYNHKYKMFIAVNKQARGLQIVSLENAITLLGY